MCQVSLCSVTSSAFGGTYCTHKCRVSLCSVSQSFTPSCCPSFRPVTWCVLRVLSEQSEANPWWPWSPNICVTYSWWSVHWRCLDAFQSVSEEHVRNVILKSAPKTCSLDLMPTSLFVECLDELLPAVTHIINSSLVSGIVPPEFKTAIVKPLLKKPSLDHNNLKNYCLVLNLSFLSKILEKNILSQLSVYLSSNNLFCSSQSAYYAGHSTVNSLC